MSASTALVLDVAAVQDPSDVNAFKSLLSAAPDAEALYELWHLARLRALSVKSDRFARRRMRQAKIDDQNPHNPCSAFGIVKWSLEVDAKAFDAVQRAFSVELQRSPLNRDRAASLGIKLMQLERDLASWTAALAVLTTQHLGLAPPVGVDLVESPDETRRTRPTTGPTSTTKTNKQSAS